MTTEAPCCVCSRRVGIVKFVACCSECNPEKSFPELRAQLDFWKAKSVGHASESDDLRRGFFSAKYRIEALSSALMEANRDVLGILDKLDLPGAGTSGPSEVARLNLMATLALERIRTALATDGLPEKKQCGAEITSPDSGGLVDYARCTLHFGHDGNHYFKG